MGNRMRVGLIASVVLWGMVLLAGAGPQVAFANDAHDAAQKGDVAELKKILADDPDSVKELDEKGWTPLHLASTFGKLDAVKLLIENKADPNGANPKGWTPLLLAALTIWRHAGRVRWQPHCSLGAPGWIVIPVGVAATR